MRRVRTFLGIGIAAASVCVGVFGTDLADSSSNAGQVLQASTGVASAALLSPAEAADRAEKSSGGGTAELSSVEGDTPAAERASSSALGSPDTQTIGSLPESAGGAQNRATARELPSSLTSALPAWRLSAPVSYASGAIKARPLPRSVSPIRRRAAITSIATKLASQQFGGSLRPADVDTFFAEFDAPVGEWLGKVESIETEPRAVWFVVFTGMESSRSTGVVIRRRDAANPPTTTSLRVISDVVVVIDDDTGEVLVASEFLSESNPAR